MVMEFAPYGSLMNILYKQETPLSWQLRLKFAIDIGAFHDTIDLQYTS